MVLEERVCGGPGSGQPSRSMVTRSMTTSSTGLSLRSVATRAILSTTSRLGAVGDLTEDRVLAVEVRGGADGDEELGPVGALTHPLAGVGHGEEVGLVELLVGVDLVVVLVARAARTATERVAALDHEPADDPVEHQAVEERGGVGAARVVAVLPLARREADEALDRLGGLVREERDDDVALVRVEGCLHAAHPFTQRQPAIRGVRGAPYAAPRGLVSCRAGKHGRMAPKSNERYAGQSHGGGTVFGRKKQPTVGDYVDVVREQAATVVSKGLDRGLDKGAVLRAELRPQGQASRPSWPQKQRQRRRAPTGRSPANGPLRPTRPPGPGSKRPTGRRASASSPTSGRPASGPSRTSSGPSRPPHRGCSAPSTTSSPRSTRRAT